MNEILRATPLYYERVWGGRALETTLDRDLPPSRPIGEAWDIVDRPEAQSTFPSGRFAGKTLREIIATHPSEIMGPDWDKHRPFPILVKWLDCHERLSLQVHPPASLASRFQGEPKTEAWFIADTQPGAELLVGLKKGVTRDQFEKALHTHTLEPLLHRFPVSKGDSVLVRSGQIHAIDGGNLILEIQQNSDTTYRVYDWGRLGLDGQPRTLHLKESLASIDWNSPEPAPVHSSPASGLIADCPEFRIRRLVLKPGETLRFDAGQQPRILSLITGLLTSSSGPHLTRGQNTILPFSGTFTFTAASPSLLLLTENFTGQTSA